MTGDDAPMLAFRRPEAECCEYIGPEGIFWSRGSAILRSDTLNGPVNHVATIPRPPLERLLGTTRLGRRLVRGMVYNLLPLSDGRLFFSFARDLGFIRDGKVDFLEGLVRPIRVLRGGIARMPDGSIVFGEYFDNGGRDVVHLYRVRPGAPRAEVIYRFAPGEIRHVHSVAWDPHVARAVVATGDVGDECRLVSFDADFRHMEVLGSGTEDWRTIRPQFAPGAIYFGTDAQFRQNRLFRYDRLTGGLTSLADVNGPVFYSVGVRDGWIFATSAELCPSQTSPEAVLYHIDRVTDGVTVLGRFEKDFWPRRLFQFGILNFPVIAECADSVPVAGTALTGLDGRFRLIVDARTGTGDCAGRMAVEGQVKA